jgi:hypothetical protein
VAKSKTKFGDGPSRPATKKKTSDSPLSEDAEKWLRQLLSEYSIVDSGGITLATQAACALDRANSARRHIAEYGLVYQDAMAVWRPNPAANILRDAESSFRGCLRMLSLDLEPVKPVGRPPGARC